MEHWCEGWMHVGDVGLRRPKQVPTNTKRHQNYNKSDNEQEWHCGVRTMLKKEPEDTFSKEMKNIFICALRQ